MRVLLSVLACSRARSATGIGSMTCIARTSTRWRLWPSRPLRQSSASPPHSCPRAGPSEWIHLWPCATSDATLPRVVNDIRLALRRLGATPLFTVFAILSLAIGVAITTAVYSIVDSVLLRGLGVREPGRVAIVATPYSGRLLAGTGRRRTSTICERRRHRSPHGPSATAFGAWLCLPRHRC